MVKPEVRLQRLKAAMAGSLKSLAGPVATAFGLKLLNPEPVKVTSRGSSEVLMLTSHSSLPNG